MQVSLSAPADVQWDFGDGQKLTVAASEASKEVTHVWTEPGSYVVTARALHPRRDVSAALDGVHSRPVEVLKPGVFQPTRSGTVATRGGLAVALCRDADLLTVARRQGESWAIDRRITTCDSPRTLALAPGPTPTHVAVCCEGDDQLQVLDLNSGQEVASYSFPWGAHPYGVLWRKDGLFVTLRARGQVAQLELDDAQLSLTRQVSATDDARGVASLPDGDLLITRWRSPADRGVVVRLRPDTGEVTEIALPWADLAPSDGESGGVPSYLDQALIAPQGDVAWLPGLHANNRDGLWRNGAPLTHETSTRAMLARLLIDSSGSIEEASDQRLLFEDRGLLQAGAISPLGDWLFLVDHGARTVERIDLARGGVLSGVILGVGYGPQGLAVSDDGEWLLVDAQLSRELVIYRLSDRGPLPQTPTVRLGLVEQEPLSPEALRGKQLFNDSFDTRLADDSYIACAHCHLDGESDGRVWDFSDRGEGLRNTPSLLGRGGLAQGPLHWSANFDELQDFEGDIRAHFGGAGLMSDEDFADHAAPLGPPKAGLSPELDALATYLTSLTTPMRSPHRQANGALSEAAKRGRALFESPSLGCVSCHSGEQFSDSGWKSPAVPVLHDVGTLSESSGRRLGAPLKGIDTPGLRGLWNAAPYLHDGRAPSLEALWSAHNSQDKHGVTSGLNAAQRADLNAYLRSL